MKEKLLKLTSVVIIISMIATIFMPFSVKSSKTTLTKMEKKFELGSTEVWKTTIDGYSNSYCVQGGSNLYAGAQLDDKGSIYTNSFTNITSKPSAVRWLFDNIYLDEGLDNTARAYMTNNLKNIMNDYASRKDANGVQWLAKSIGLTSIDSNWVSKAIDAVISDKDTLFAVQQYAIWNFVNNGSSNYTNALQNSDGSYCKLPGAKIDQKYYIAYYVTLREMAKAAQNNNYVSPNSSGKFEVSLENNSAKVTLQSDKRTVLMGPYTLKNNHSQVVKTLTATVNSENASSVQIVNEKGQTVDIKTYTGKFYFKITYSKGFSKGVTYKIKPNIKVTGYKTFANILNPSGDSKQPLASIRKEAYSINLGGELDYREEITGKYNLEIYKIDADNKPLSNVKFNVREITNNSQDKGKEYTTSNKGIATIEEDREIKKPGLISYEITEIKTSDNTYIPLAESFQVNVKTETVNEAYKVTSVYFRNGLSYKDVKLQDGNTVKVVASVSNNNVSVTIPNNKMTGSYSLEIIKKDLNGTVLPGFTFDVQYESEAKKNYGPTSANGSVAVASKTITSEGTDKYTIWEAYSQKGYIPLKEPLEVYVTKKIQNFRFEATEVSFDKSKVVKNKLVELKNNEKVNINAKIENGKISITVPNKKIEGSYSLDILKVDEKETPVSGIGFNVKTTQNSGKTRLHK